MKNEKTYKAELVGVFGYPISENPTVIMQEAAFKEKNIDFRYLTIEVKPEDLKDAINGLRACNFKGINITIPHKVEVLKYIDGIAEDAKLIGAVNTIYRKGNKLYGENTDGKGFILSLRNEGQLDPKGGKFVVMGAGGAARAITVELALNGAEHIIILNRSREHGETLVDLLNNNTNVKAEFVFWDDTYKIPEDTDVLVNATSIGLYPNINDKANVDYRTIKEGMTVCDVIPNPPETAFLKEAQKMGAKTLNGLGMLVHQGAIGFKMWTGEDAPEAVMKTSLLHEFETEE